ncbi:MAG: hypothetical protein AAFA34_05095 [Thermoplasmata archaeon]|jgi:predicted TIM-barrel fold metal-dependent hydrolase
MKYDRPPSESDRAAGLARELQRLEAELGRLAYEEEFVDLQIRQAREQIAYYEQLLKLLRKDWGQVSGLADLLQRMP